MVYDENWSVIPMLQGERISLNMFTISMVLFSGDVERALRGAQPPLLKFRRILGGSVPLYN